MMALYILAGLLLLLFLPIGVRFRFHGGSRLVVRYAGVPIYRFDSEKEQRKPPKKAAEKSEKPTRQKKSTQGFLDDLNARLKKDGVAAVAEYLSALGRLLIGTARRLLRTLHFRRCRVSLAVGGEDAADVALKYGKLCGPVAAAATLLRQMMRIRCLSVEMTPDFLHEDDRIEADVQMYVIPLAALWAAVRTVCAYIGMTIKLSKESEEVQDG